MNITKITRRDKIRGVADAWFEQYKNSKPPFMGDSKEKLFALIALDKEAATADDVAEIIGNYTWTDLTCRRCDIDYGEGFEIKHKTDEAIVCEVCLNLMLGENVPYWGE